MSLANLIAKMEASEKAWEELAEAASQKAKETWVKILSVSQPKGE